MLSAVAKTFANWKLRNSSDVNETYMTYVYNTLPHFISKKMRVWMKGGRGHKQIYTKKSYEIMKTSTFLLGEGVQFLQKNKLKS